MVSLILAMTPSGGIGLNGKLPWHCKEELGLFKRITDNSIVIVGYTTYKSLPKLPNRTIFVVSRTFNHTNDEGVFIYKSLEDAISAAGCAKTEIDKEVFIIGGASLYNQMFIFHRHIIDTVYLSIMNVEYNHDARVDLKFFLSKLIITEKTQFDEFVHYVLIKQDNAETQYRDLVRETQTFGSVRTTRNGYTQGVFGKTLNFNLLDGFPLLTTKRMYIRGIIEELLFFIRGDTDTKLLEKKNVNIWSKNTSREWLDANNKSHLKEGLMGPMYGAQWRHFGGDYDNETGRMIGGKDQFEYLIHNLKTDRYSRRHLMTTYNPTSAESGVLYPCHSLILQFFIEDEFLDAYCYNRSSDIFLGLPFNIASTALLVHLIAKLVRKTARKITLALGDAHLYAEHTIAVNTQLSRIPYKLPQIRIEKSIETIADLEKLEYSDFIITDYNYHPTIEAPMMP